MCSSLLWFNICNKSRYQNKEQKFCRSCYLIYIFLITKLSSWLTARVIVHRNTRRSACLHTKAHTHVGTLFKVFVHLPFPPPPPVSTSSPLALTFLSTWHLPQPTHLSLPLYSSREFICSQCQCFGYHMQRCGGLAVHVGLI